MPYYRQIGEVPPKRHTQHRAPDGKLYYEELMGEEGFSSDSSGVEFFDEPAVMVDTFHPLELGEGGQACEDPGYAWTWAGRGPGR